MLIVHRLRETSIHLWDSLNAKLAEWMCAAWTVAIGYILTLDPTTQTTSVTYGVFVLMFGEDVVSSGRIGQMVAFAGLCRLVLLGINGAWHSSPYPRAAAAGCTSLFWVLIFWMFYTAAGFHNLATWTYLILAGADFVNVTRSMRDAAASVFIRSGQLVRKSDGTLVVAGAHR